jgi:hypothetical protein
MKGYATCLVGADLTCGLTHDDEVIDSGSDWCCRVWIDCGYRDGHHDHGYVFSGHWTGSRVVMGGR